MTRFTRWEPLREALTLRDAMNRLFEDSYVRPGWNDARDGGSTEPLLRLPLDAYTTESDIVILASVPGVNPEDVELTIEGDTLTIRGEIPGPLANTQYLLQERGYGRFSRTLMLNVPIQADKASADFENGLLTITIPKAEAVRPRSIKVGNKQTT